MNLCWPGITEDSLSGFRQLLLLLLYNSHTVQTADGIWRRHVDQLLQTPLVPAESSFEDPKDALNSSVYPPVQVQNSTTTETTVPVVDMTEKEIETSSVTSVPQADSSPKSPENDVSSDRQYPTRERRLPVCLSY